MVDTPQQPPTPPTKPPHKRSRAKAPLLDARGVSTLPGPKPKKSYKRKAVAGYAESAEAEHQRRYVHMKYPDQGTRRAFWADLCTHISGGYSMQSYPGADEDTIYKYGADFPEDCPMAALNEAKRKSRLFWERIGMAGATGKMEGFNAASWIFNMKNRAGWVDKREITGKDGGPIEQKNSLTIVDENALKNALNEIESEL